MSAYKLQATRFPQGQAVAAAQGSECSIAVFAITAYGEKRASVSVQTVNVALTRARDLFIMVADRDALIMNSKSTVETVSGLQTSGVRGLMTHSVNFDEFVKNVRNGDITRINDLLRESGKELGQSKKRRWQELRDANRRH